MIYVHITTTRHCNDRIPSENGGSMCSGVSESYQVTTSNNLEVGDNHDTAYDQAEAANDTSYTWEEWTSRIVHMSATFADAWAWVAAQNESTKTQVTEFIYSKRKQHTHGSVSA